jgi:hypothetical protein
MNEESANHYSFMDMAIKFPVWKVPKGELIIKKIGLDK